jgi:membrane dipeptidase
MHRDIPIFDCHHDALLRLSQLSDPVSAFRNRGDDGHLDLVRAQAGGFAGRIFRVGPQFAT